MQERKVSEERTPRIFILVHSNLSYIQFVKATLAWLCTISKVLQSIHPYTSKICKNTTKDSWITQESHQHSKNPLADLENHQAHTQSLRKIKPQWYHYLAYHKPLSPRSIFNNWTPMITKERVSTSYQNQIVL